MMAPDYTHWHGTYEVAKKFYAEYVPQLEALAARFESDADPDKAKAAAALMPASRAFDQATKAGGN